MSTDKYNKNSHVVRAILLIAVIALQVVFVGMLKAKPQLQQKGSDASSRLNARLQSAAEAKYKPGEVVIKLKGEQTGRILLSSQSYSTIEPRHKAILQRLQNEYGLHDGNPIFRGLYPRMQRQDSSKSNMQDRIGVTLETKLMESVQRLADPAFLNFYLMRTDGDVSTICAQLKNDPDVEYAQPNYIYHICNEPNDPDFPDQYAHQLIQMSDAWDISTGSRDVVIAVMDTGVDINHPDLKDNIWTNEDEIPDNGIDDDENGYVDDVNGWNFGDSNNDVNPDEDYYYIAGHGTMVSGVIAAVGNNGIGVTGVNWQCSIMPLRLSLDFTSAEVAAALEYAAVNGAHIVNMSFGGDDFGPEGDPIVKEAIDSAFAQGVLLVASAGNDDTIKPHYPAAYYNVMAVASTDGEDIKTGHSSFGTWVDIAAPGTDIVTTDLNGEYIATAGTSFSSPYVAAVGALVLSHSPELTNMDVRAILENTTDPVYYGDINPEKGYIGTGRVNAYNALMSANRRYPLGEIVNPMPQQTFASDVNNIPITLFIHGDSYQLDYRIYEGNEWTLISQGGSPSDSNSLINLSFAKPGIGAFELRLCVTTDGYTHTDCKTFGIDFASYQAHWPKLEEVEYPPEEYFTGSPMCLDVDGDGRNEIIQASEKYVDYSYEVKINIWKEDGTLLPAWSKTLESYYGYYAPPFIAVGDIDGDGDYEMIAADDYYCEVYAWHVETGKLVDGNWPVAVGDFWYGYITTEPVIADLDGDGDSEVIVALDVESGESDGLYAIKADGTFLWQRRYTSEGPISAADFDHDGDVEIALCGYGPGLSRVYTFILNNQGQQIKRWSGGSTRGTAIADLDADGVPELVFCTEDRVKAVHIDGSTLWTSSFLHPFSGVGAFSVGDIDSDGHSEVYVNTYVEADGFSFSLVHAFDDKGHLLTNAGFPKIIMGYPARSTPLIVDIDGDGQKELVVGLASAPIIAWEKDGSVAQGFPMLNLSTELYSTPVFEDLDQDGDIEMILNGYDYRFHVIDLPGRYDSNSIDWGMSRHDPQNSAWTLASPKIDPISAPTEIKPGQRLELHPTTQNPSNLPIHLFVGNLPEGAYYDAATQTAYWKPAADQVFHTYTLSFLVTDGIRQHSRGVSVTVVPDAIYYTNMDTDPNWQLDPGWAWGVPTGTGSWNGDPNSGYTGENVIGYNLNGDYENALNDTMYATTGAINCEGYRNIRLSFRRWLGVESPYDYANIQVSNDGLNWVDIWTTGYSHINDKSWQLMEYTVPSSVADGQPTVYFRWGIGPTDDSVTYPGWNIDDIQVTGEGIY